MDKVHFVDQTIRDAQQSLWGLMMRTDHIAPIAEMMDKVGYLAVATVGSQAFTIQVRNHDEDPWERIRVLSGLMPATCLRGSYQTASLSSFDLSTPRDVISLWIKRSVANGIRSFWICDYQENMERFRYFAQIAKAEGAEVVTSLMYTSSPLHTDDHWVEKTRLIADAKDCIDRIMIEDASGVITPERTRELVSIVQRNCDGIPLEFHATAIRAWLLCAIWRLSKPASRPSIPRSRLSPTAPLCRRPRPSSRTSAAWVTSRTWTRTLSPRSRLTSGRSPKEKGCPSEGRWSTTSSISSIRCPAA